MKKSLVFILGLSVTTASLHAAPLFSDDFNTYSAGNLVGQGGWSQTGATATTPIQVSSGKAALGISGQDVYSALPGGISSFADGSTFYLGLNLNVSAAQATGDYFLHYSPTVGESSLFFDRLFVKSSGAGFVLGYLATSGTGSGVLYGSTVLSFNTDYRTVLAYNAVAGTQNDTAAIYVNPSDLSVELNNTAYATFGWNGGTVSAENHNVAAVNLRQGGNTASATLTVDNLNASQSFADVATYTAVPEPASITLLGISLTALLIRRRK